MEQEHYDKYERLAQRLGVAALRDRVRTIGPPSKLFAALRADEHLNSIPLAVWDRLALGEPKAITRHCATCQCRARQSWSPGWPGPELKESAREIPWNAQPSLSLAERVCVLKHVARYHYASPFADAARTP